MTIRDSIQTDKTARKRRPQDVTPFERRCHRASDQQIIAVQERLRRCAANASQAVPGGIPPNFLAAIQEIRLRPELMLDVAPELRGVVEAALSEVGA